MGFIPVPGECSLIIACHHLSDSRNCRLPGLCGWTESQPRQRQLRLAKLNTISKTLSEQELDWGKEAQASALTSNAVP